MPKTEVRSNQIKDGTVGRSDLNTATPGEAVTAKIVAGTGVSISSTGADTGTGDVTITASGGGAHALTHKQGGSDPVDVKTLAGYPADGSLYLNGLGSFNVPPAPANVAFKNQQNVFTSRQTIIPSTGTPNPYYGLEIQGSPVLGGNHASILYNSTDRAVDDRKLRMTLYNGAFTFDRLNDAETAVNATPFQFDWAGNAKTAANMTAGTAVIATDHVAWGLRNGGAGGAAYLIYDGVTATMVSPGGGITLSVGSYGSVVRFINQNGPYIQWDGTTYTDICTPQYLRLYPFSGHILAFGTMTFASYVGGGPAILNDFGNGLLTSLRVDVSPLSYYFRSTGTNAFFCGTAGGANCGHPSYPWAAVYANAGTIQPSDVDLKENIQPNNLGLEFIEKLQAKRFDYKQKDVKKGHIGFMAQDVEEALAGESFAALDKPEKGPSGLNYAGFVPILVQAIQELSARIRTLET